MKFYNTPFLRKLTLIACAITALQSCVNEEYNFDNLKTDNITLFGDSIILPLGSTQEILMSDIITEELMNDAGISTDGSGYNFDYSGAYPEDGSTMNFGIEPITIAAPELPIIASSTIDVGSFSIKDNPISLTAGIESDIYSGTASVEFTGDESLPPYDPERQNPDNYQIIITENKEQPKRSRLRLPSIGQPLNLRSLIDRSEYIGISQNSSASADIPIAIPEGVAINKVFDLNIGNGSVTISLSTSKSTGALATLEFDYSELYLVFPEEFVLELTPNVTLINGRYKAAFAKNGSMTVKLQKIDFSRRTTGDKFLPTNTTSTVTSFNFGYEGTLYVKRPSKLEDLITMHDATVLVQLGVNINGSINALSLEAQGLEKNIDIAPVTINIGEIDIPKEVLALQSVSIKPVTMSIKVPKINLGEKLSSASINGYLELQLPDFCSVAGATKVGDKWKIAFSNLQTNDLNININISEINTPPIVDGKIKFNSETISVSGKASIPDFRVDDINEINLSGANAPTIAPSLGYANNITMFEISTFKAAIGANGGDIKVSLEQLAGLRGENEGDISIDNISFTNPLMNIKLLYSLPYDFDATITLEPYLKDQLITEGVMTFETVLSANAEGVKTLTPTADQVNKLINQLPDYLILSYDIKAGSTQQLMLFEMNKLGNINFKTDYAITLPLAFGEGMEISKTIDTDVASLFSDEKVIGLLFGEEKSKLTLIGQADNGIPFDISLTFLPKDADGNLIPESEVSIPGTILKAGAIIDNKPVALRTAFDVTVIGTPTNIKRVATLGIKVKAVAASNAAIRPDCTLKLALKAKILGGIKLDQLQ